MKKVLLLFLTLIGSNLMAQMVLTPSTYKVTETFDSLPLSGTGNWVNNVDPKGWYAWKTNAYSAYTQIQADSGGLNSGKIYSYGSTNKNERALGSLASGSSDRVCYGWRLQNKTGATITSISVSYYGEQWRQAGTADNRLAFYYKIDNAIDSLTYDELKFGTNMTAVTDLDFVSPQKSTTSKALDGNDAANRVFITDTLQINLLNDYEIFLLWVDSNDVGSDNALALDEVDVTIISSGAADNTPPEVKDVTLIGNDTLKVRFSEPVSASTAQNTANYTLNPTASISSAVLDTSNNTVTLVTSLTSSVSYNLIVANIEDLASPANKMDPDTTFGIIYSPYSSTLKISSVDVKSIDTLQVFFSESVEQSSAENAANYIFTPAVSISSVSYDDGDKKVTIIGTRTSGKSHQLVVSGIKDDNTPSKIIYPDTARGIIYNNYTGSALVISEIAYNDRTALDALEFVELYNNGTSSIEMGAIKFSKGIDYTFGEYTLAPKQTVIVAKYTDTFYQTFGINAIGAFSGGLSNSGEAVEIVNSNGLVLDNVVFDDASPWDVAADGFGPSLQLKSHYANNTDNDNGANWAVDYINFGLLPGGDTIWASPGFVAVTNAPIAQVRRENSDGVNAANGGKVELRGIVYGVNQRATGFQFSLIDATGAISVFSTSKNFGYTVKEADSVHVIGFINQFRGLSQLENPDTLIYISSGNSLKDPVVMAKPSEAGESDLIKVLSYTIIAPDANWVSNKNYKATNGTDTIEVRIDGDTEVDGNPIPAGPLNITGLGSQFDASLPLTEGYQIIPRFLSDIEALSSAPDPEIGFASTSATVSEMDGAYKVLVKISNPNTNKTNFTIEKLGGTANAGVDYNAALPASLFFDASSSANVELNINVLNNVLVDGNRTLQLVLRNTDNNATIGSDSIFILTISDDDAAKVDISTLKANAADGRPSLENQKVRAQGVVYGVDIRGGTGMQFTIIDNTGGIAVFTPALEFGYAVHEGDQVTVQGLLGFFNGLTQIAFLDTIIYEGTGKSLKSPVKVNQVSETTESDLVKIEKVWFLSDTVTVWPTNGDVFVTNGTDTIDVRIDKDLTDIAGQMVPTYDTMNIVGLGSQFDATSPFTSGYQLMPRYMADIEKWVNPNSGSVAELNWQVRTYPNPANNNVHIIADRMIESWSLISLNGMKVSEGKAGAIDFSVNVASINHGVYMLELYSNNTVHRVRIIKN